MLFSFWDILFIVRWSDTTEIMCEDLPRISNIIFIITLYLIVLSPLQTSVRRIIWFYVIACIFIMLTLQTGIYLPAISKLCVSGSKAPHFYVVTSECQHSGVTLSSSTVFFIYQCYCCLRL